MFGTFERLRGAASGTSDVDPHACVLHLRGQVLQTKSQQPCPDLWDAWSSSAAVSELLRDRVDRPQQTSSWEDGKGPEDWCFKVAQTLQISYTGHWFELSGMLSTPCVFSPPSLTYKIVVLGICKANLDTWEVHMRILFHSSIFAEKCWVNLVYYSL